MDGIGVTRYSYDGVSQILSEDGPWSDDTVTYGYTAMQRTSLSLQQPTGSWTNGFAYDGAKRLTNVTSPAGAFNYYYDAVRSMLPGEITLPNTSYITNAYDLNARLLSTVLKNSAGATLDAAEYGYNVGNQRTTFTNAAGTQVGYTYDPIGQLTVANSSVSTENRGYAYDAAWNLAHLTNNGVTTNFSVNNLNELTNAGSTAFLYDGNGNLTNGIVTLHGTTNIYDDENRLIWASAEGANLSTASSFVYDGLGRLREQVQWSANGGAQLPSLPTNGWTLVGGIAYIYDGNRVIQERDLNNNPTVSYTRGNDLSGTLEGAGGIGGLLARSDGYSSGNFSEHDFYHADGNGNITYLVNSSQTLAASYRYDPFGNLISSSGALAPTNTYQFSSKEYIPTVGLYYYLYRFYNPGLQRWMNRDPINETGGLNLYALPRNDLINKRDRLGLCFADCAGACAYFNSSANPYWQYNAIKSPGTVICNGKEKCACYVPTGANEQNGKPADPPPGECPDWEKIIKDHETSHFPDVDCGGVQPGNIPKGWMPNIQGDAAECEARMQTIIDLQNALPNESGNCKDVMQQYMNLLTSWVEQNCD